MSDSVLTGAIIGAGYFAGFHAEGWQRIHTVRITAVADPVAETARKFAARWQIPRTHASLEELLCEEKPDFVDIVTRPETHLHLVEQAARNNSHVICQKPMAATWAECEAMVTICRAAGVRLLIHENWRWQAWYREVRRLIDSGIFGRIYHMGFCMRSGDGRGNTPYPVQPYFNDMPRLLIYESLVHLLDTFRYLGGEIEWIFCRTRRINQLIKGEDYALILVGFAAGGHGLIDANRISGPVPPEVAFGVFVLEGERARLRMTPQGDLYLTVYGEAEIRHDYDKTSLGYKGDSVQAAQAHYADCLRLGTACETEGDDYLKTVAAVFACYKSAEEQKVIRLS